MAESYNVRVRCISGETRILLAKDFHWVGEEGARSATAILDGREVPIYKRSEPEWGNMWVEQTVVHDGTCIECERVSMLLNDAGVCMGCVMQAVIDAQQERSN